MILKMIMRTFACKVTIIFSYLQACSWVLAVSGARSVLLCGVFPARGAFCAATAKNILIYLEMR
jgi:hypothetical protein